MAPRPGRPRTEPTKITYTRLPRSLAQKLFDEALHQGRTVSMTIRRILEAYFKDKRRAD